MEEIKVIIGKNIRNIREQQGKSLQTLGDEIGISRQQLSRIEHGSGTSQNTLERIANVLGVDMKILMDEYRTTSKSFVSSPKESSFEETNNNSYSYKKLYDTAMDIVKEDVIEKFLRNISEILLKEEKEIIDKMIDTVIDTEVMIYPNIKSNSQYQFDESQLRYFCSFLLGDFVKYISKYKLMYS